MSRVPLRLVLRFAVFLGILALGVLVVRLPQVRERLELETLATTLEELREEPLAPPLLVVGTALLTAVGLPASIPVLASGAVFGAVYGFLLAYLGTLGGALLSFVLAHTLARELVTRILGPRLRPLETLLERHGFWTLFRMRYVPVPFAVTNYAAALAGLRFPVYLSSTAVGLVPVTLIYTYFASTLVSIAQVERGGVVRDLLIATILVLLLSFLPPRIIAWWQARARRRRSAPSRPPAGRS